MNRHRFLGFGLSVTTLVFGVSCGPNSAAAAKQGQHAHGTDTHDDHAHDDHAHGSDAHDNPAQAPHEHEPTSTTVFGERLLLFMEYPHLVRGVPARFLAHLTVLATGEPVRSGSVRLEIGAARLSVDAPKREGVFIPEGSSVEAGTFQGRLIVKSEQAEETLELGEIVVHASEASADEAAHAQGGEEPPNAVPFLMEPQWKVKLLLAQAAKRTLSKRLIVPARAVAPEGMSAAVSATVGGRLAAPPSGALPRTGDRVEAGQTLAFVEPPLGAAELAQLHALDLEFDLKALDVLRAAGEAQTRVRFAERERERIAKLRAEGLSTQQQLEQAEQNLALARAEVEAAGRTKDSLDRLVAKRGADGSKPGAPLRFPLQAPIAGSVIEVLGVPGLGVEAGEPVFRILDSSRIWVEGRVSEFDLSRISYGSKNDSMRNDSTPIDSGRNDTARNDSTRIDGTRIDGTPIDGTQSDSARRSADSTRTGAAPSAVGEFAAFPGRRFELRGARDGKPYIGPEVDPSSRTLLVRYELDNTDGAVRPGMLAELQISTGEHEARVAIPIESVVMEQGLATAYVMLEGELFQKRDLELGAKDGAWVEVIRGVEPGERVATRGAYIVKLAALSPASFGAGHAH